MGRHGCRLCSDTLSTTFVDLGMSPPCEDFLTSDRADGPETFYPLQVFVCDRCLLVQLPEHLPADEIFTDEYRYYSSFSSSWVEHARRYATEVTRRLGLGSDDLVIEVASNDGYLLQHFVAAGIPVLGVEPCGGVAAAAEERGVRTETLFLGEETAHKLVERYGRADLLVGNNVFAHVPDLADFVRGLAVLLSPGGLLTLEFPHLQRLMEHNQYDTIYHEHFSYFTLLTAQRALALGGLTVTDVEQLPTHGGSLRLHVRHADSGHRDGPRVADLLAAERDAGLHTLDGHTGFAGSVARVKRDLLRFLVDTADAGRTIAGYGAPGKGNTLLNHCGIRRDLLPFTVDANPHKHGMFLPGTHIPVLPPEELRRARPDYVLLLPWNLRDELSEQLGYVRDWGGRLVVAIPELEVLGGRA